MSWVLLCSHAIVKWGIQLCGSSPSAKTTNWCCRPLLPSQCSCKCAAWISSHFCKCNSQVSPPRRGPCSGNRGSWASSSLCSYSMKPHQCWKYNLWKKKNKKEKKKKKERKKASVKLSHSAAQNFQLCFFHHLLIAPLLCSLSNSSRGCQALFSPTPPPCQCAACSYTQFTAVRVGKWWNGPWWPLPSQQQAALTCTEQGLHVAACPRELGGRGAESTMGFINRRGGDGSAVLSAICIKSVRKEGEKLWTSGCAHSWYEILLSCWHKPVSVAPLNNSLN